MGVYLISADPSDLIACKSILRHLNAVRSNPTCWFIRFVGTASDLSRQFRPIRHVIAEIVGDYIVR